jgi:hypothetical protein
MSHQEERPWAGDGPDAAVVAGAEVDVQPPRARRRFRRGRPSPLDGFAGTDESVGSLRAEVVLLREENARLKALQHRRSDIGRLLGRARSLPSAEADRESLDDETAQLLVDGLVVRESLVEICQEIERSMVAFEAKLNALASAAGDRSFPPAGADEAEGSNGHGPPRGHARSAADTGQTNGHGPSAA